MPAKYPNGARNETIRCEKCGEDYAATYKRCPFCEDDEPTMIFRRPKVREEDVEEAPRRRRPESVVEMPSPRPVRPVLEDDPDDEYEELFRRRVPKEEAEAPRPVRRPRAEEESPRPVRRSRPAEGDHEEEPPRKRSRQVDDDYEEEPKRRRGRRHEEDEEDDYESPRRSRRDDYDDEDDDDDYDEPRRGRGDGGKRLVTNARGGGYRHRGPSPGSIIGAVISIILVVAAIWIVYSIVTSLKGNSDPTPPVDTPTPSISTSVTPSPSNSDEPGDIVIPSDDPNSQPPVVGSEQPTTPPVVTTIPDGQTATGFDLGKTEFTLSDTYPSYPFKVKFIPEGSTGSITWSSSKPNIVSVDQNGKVTAVAQGIATITATMAGGYSKQCMVRSTYGGTPGPAPSTPATTSPSTPPSVAPSTSPSSSPSTGGKLSLNVPLGLDGVVYDFSLKVGETWNLKVKNATGTASWSIKDSSIATIDANGKVTGVAKGMTKATATVDGQTLECIVRVSG